MIEQEFLRRVGLLNARVVEDYWNGEEIDGIVKAMELLCHNFIQIKEKGLEDEEREEIKDNGAI